MGRAGDGKPYGYARWMSYIVAFDCFARTANLRGAGHGDLIP